MLLKQPTNKLFAPLHNCDLIVEPLIQVDQLFNWGQTTTLKIYLRNIFVLILKSSLLTINFDYIIQNVKCYK